MNKRTSKIIAFTAILSMLAPSMASCGQPSGTSSSTPSTSSSTPASSTTSASASASSTPTGEPDTKGINVTGLPLVKEKETIRLAVRINDGDPSNVDVRFWKELEEKTNVHVEWSETLTSAWTEKKNVMMAANDQPDAYLGGAFTADDIVQLGSSGKVLAIQDYIDTFMPNVSAAFTKNPAWKSGNTAPDGNVYSVPSIMEVGGGSFAFANPPLINKTWLDNVTLSFKADPLTPMTKEQFKEVLTAFKTQDPNKNGKADEIPWSPLNVESLYDWGASFGMLGKTGKTLGVYINSGKATWAVAQPEFKEFATWLNDLWAGGLLDTETFTQNSSMQSAKVKNPDNIIGYTSAWRVGNLQIDEKTNHFTQTVPLKASETYAPSWPKGDSFSLYRDSFLVTSSAKNPELCLRWADNLCEPENSLQINSAQLIGEHLEKQADGTYKQLRPIDWNREGERSIMPGSKLYMVTKEIWQKQQTLPPVSIQKDPVDELFNASYAPKDMEAYPSSVWMTVEDAKTINQILSEVQPYIDSTFATWVTAGGIDAQWDEFQKTLTGMGADKALEIYQKYYDQQK